MDAPPIQYAQTEDGVNIAYWTLGEGAPLIQMASAPSHLTKEWELPHWRAWYESLAKHWMVVRYDERGVGLSAAARFDFSTRARVADLDAVIEELGASSVALLAPIRAGTVAIRFAVQNPSRVDGLVLWCSFAKEEQYTSSSQIKTLQAIRQLDWTVYTETTGSVLLGWSAPEAARDYAALYRASWTEETMALLAEQTAREGPADVGDILDEVTVPTLVVHRRDNAAVGISAATALAAGIPHSRLVVLEGESALPQVGDIDEAIAQLESFLAADSAERDRPDAGTFKTIMFTDLESSAALTQRLGDEAAQEVLHGHNAVVRKSLEDNGGREVKHTGDGIMAAFPSAVRAVEAGLQIQRELAGGDLDGTGVRVRIGLNAGEPIAEDDDFFGTAVQLAARVCDRAEPGQVLVSNVVRELCAGKKLTFNHHSDATLKGFDEPVALYEVGD